MMKTLKGWRNFRSDLLMAAEYFINAACGTECLMKGPLTQRSQNLLTKIERLNNSFTVVSDGIFFIEDNFYYRSMRYEWFQIARRMNIGFCEIFLQCPLNTAIHRNSIRGYSIPEQKIRMMVSALEYPNPRQFKWEKYSLVFDSSSEFSCSELRDMIKLIEEAAKNPAERLMSEEKLEAQKLCSMSVVHQADKILRKIIGKKIVFLKENIFTAEHFESLVELTISIRQDILNGIRSRVIPLPEELLDNFHTFGIEKFFASGNDIGETLKILFKTNTFKKEFFCLDNKHIFGGDQGYTPEIMDEILTTARDLELEVNEDDIEELIMGHEDELTTELQEILKEHQETQ
ncbi:l-seryl-tRNA(Sec) kinase [Trichonephila clavipes]|nr:l-seryl-tRNA(Sec) kinase [Trichonephila clavipes]